MSTFPLMFRLVDAPDQPVIGPDHPDLDGNKYGFEGGCFVRETGGNLAVQPPAGPAQWSEDIRAPLGLIAEDDGTFTMLYTGKLRGHKVWPVGLARLALA